MLSGIAYGQDSSATSPAPSAISANAALTAPSSAKPERSQYEQESIAIAAPNALEDTAPEGKLVEGIDVVRLEVFEDRDPAPNLLNMFHATTLDDVIRREVLLRPGERYKQVRVDETARNLRVLPQLSVVLLVPVRGSQENRVRLLVITKDVWSLRVGWDPAFSGPKLTSIVLQPSESNLLGTHQRVIASLRLDPNQASIGANYVAPRIGGSRIEASVFGNLAVNCANGEPEGGNAGLSYVKPLFSAETRWAWGTEAYFSSNVFRRPARGSYSICSNPAPRARAIALPVAAGQDPLTVALPDQLRSRVARAQARITRSFFRYDKIDLTLGLELEHLRWSPLPVSLEGLQQYRGSGTARVQEAATTENALQAIAIREAQISSTYDTRLGPYLQLHAYSNRFLSTLNYATLGLQEDIRLGHDVYFKLYPALRPISSRSYLGTFASAAYTLPWGDGFARAVVSAKLELAAAGREDDPEAKSAAQMSRTRLFMGAHLATPQSLIGRLATNFIALRSPRTIYVSEYSLGSSDFLRGYAPATFSGRDLIALNTEFRTRPLEFYSVLAGLDIFWDMGDVPDSLANFKLTSLKHSAGLGLRLLFPQLDRDIFRIDVAWPIERGTTWGSLQVTAGFRQIFGAPASRPDPVIPQ